jgi:NADH-quinone oxidoreductase subunit K
MLHPVYPLSLSLAFFALGLMGVVFNRKSILLVLMSLELMLLSVNLLLLSLSALMNDVDGQIFAFFILTVAAAESAIGLAILVVYYRLMGSIAAHRMSLLRD